MKPIIIFAGTSEGRILAETLDKAKKRCHICVATEYGGRMIPEGKYMQIHTGRMDKERMISFLRERSPEAVVDATHPYAEEVSENIRGACEEAGLPCYRLARGEGRISDASAKAGEEFPAEMIHYVNSVEEAAHYLNKTQGNVLLTTGGKELHKYTQIVKDRNRLYARVLSVKDSVENCLKLGFEGKHLICMQGPFTEEMNCALLRQVNAGYLVTKESGAAGGFIQKLRGARRAGVKCVVVRRPAQETGYSLEELADMFGAGEKAESAGEVLNGCVMEPDKKREEELTGKKRNVTLLGVGMGARENLTIEGEAACKEADVFIGAGRALKTLAYINTPSVSMYRAEEIADYIKTHPQYRRILVALSGDVGFYSGAKALAKALEDCSDVEINMLCGISSPAYFAAKLRLSWDDMHLMSLHGREQNLIRALTEHKKVFTLVGKAGDIREMAGELCTYGYEEIAMYVGTNLSYPDESILKGTPRNFFSFDKEGVSSVILIRGEAQNRVCTHGIPDEAFFRGDVPMTKEEARSVSVSKLRLKKDSVIYDVGAGTGSVSVECAVQSCEGRVYAIEQKQAVLSLLYENKKKFKASNLEIIFGKAPEALSGLAKPTHVFIGGSSGQMEAILRAVFEKNPGARVVINAIALETMAQIMGCLGKFDVEDVDICSIFVGKSKRKADYHMMMGQNPVYIVSFQGKGGA